MVRLLQLLHRMVGLAACLPAVCVAATIQAISGNHQFLAGLEIPARITTWAPVVVQVREDDGRPLADRPVSFTLESPDGKVAFPAGTSFTRRTDGLGRATLTGIETSGASGFFNVTADAGPSAPGRAYFLMSQYGHVTCSLGGGRGDTRTTLGAERAILAAGERSRLVASVTDPSTGASVGFGDIALTASDRILAVGALDPLARVVFDLPLPSGAHVITARVIEGCSYRTSVSVPVVQLVTSGQQPAGEHTDMWWNPAESGWGMSIIQHPSRKLFVVWYHYRDDGTPDWLAIPDGVWTSPARFTGPLYRTSGPPTGGPFDPSRVTFLPAGVAELGFEGTDRATFTWSLSDGRQGRKSISRQPF